MSAHPTVATTPSASPYYRSTPTAASSSSRRSCCRSCSRRGASRPCSTCSSLEREADDDAAEQQSRSLRLASGAHALGSQPSGAVRRQQSRRRSQRLHVVPDYQREPPAATEPET